MNSIVHVLNAVWPYLAVGAVITIGTQVVRRLAKLKRKSVIRLVFHTVTILATALTWWADHGLAWYMLLLHGGTYSGVANALYPVVKWGDSKAVQIRAAMKLVNKDLPGIQKAVEDLTAPVETTESAQKTNTKPPAANF